MTHKAVEEIHIDVLKEESWLPLLSPLDPADLRHALHIKNTPHVCVCVCVCAHLIGLIYTLYLFHRGNAGVSSVNIGIRMMPYNVLVHPAIPGGAPEEVVCCIAQSPPDPRFMGDGEMAAEEGGREGGIDVSYRVVDGAALLYSCTADFDVVQRNC